MHTSRASSGCRAGSTHPADRGWEIWNLSPASSAGAGPGHRDLRRQHHRLAAAGSGRTIRGMDARVATTSPPPPTRGRSAHDEPPPPVGLKHPDDPDGPHECADDDCRRGRAGRDESRVAGAWAWSASVTAEGSLFSVFVVVPVLHRQEPQRPVPREVRDLLVLATIAPPSSSVFVAPAARSRGGCAGCGRWLAVTVALGGIFRLHGRVVRPDLPAPPHDRTTLSGRPSIRSWAARLMSSSGSPCSACAACSRGRGPPAAHAERVEMVSWYWHFVDAVWIVVFTFVYLICRSRRNGRRTRSRCPRPPRGPWCWGSASRWPSPASSPTSR